MELELANGSIGSSYRIKYIKPSQIRLRLFEMGIFRNSRVEIIRSAPFKDPIEYRINDFYVSLRRSEASKIIVELI